MKAWRRRVPSTLLSVLLLEQAGRTRFRAWDEQRVNWLLGWYGDRWAMVGLLMRDGGDPGDGE